MRLSADPLLLYAAPLTALAVSVVIGGSAYALGVAAGAVLGAGASYLMMRRRLRRLSPHALVFVLWFVLGFLALVTGSPVLAGVSVSVLVLGFLALHAVRGWGAATSVVSFIISYVVSESLLEAMLVYGFPPWYYLACLVNVKMYWWLTPPFPVRVGFAVSVAYLMLKYVLAYADTRLRACLTYALVGVAGAWSLTVALLISSSTFTDSPYMALLMTMVPLLLLTFLSR
jgi:hypothetical protein